MQPRWAVRLLFTHRVPRPTLCPLCSVARQEANLDKLHQWASVPLASRWWVWSMRSKSRARRREETEVRTLVPPGSPCNGAVSWLGPSMTSRSSLGLKVPGTAPSLTLSVLHRVTISRFLAQGYFHTSSFTSSYPT